MPNARSDVGDDVGVELVLFDLVFEVVLMPGSVGALNVDKPLVRRFGFAAMLTDCERHRGLDVIPRVGVSAREPRDHARRKLPVSDVGRRVADLC